MNQQSIHENKNDFYQKILIIDSFLDNPANPDSIFSLLGWLKRETNEMVRLELIHTISILFERSIHFHEK